MFFNKKQEAPVQQKSVKPASARPALVEDKKVSGASLADLVGKSVIVSPTRTSTEIKEVFVREVSPSGEMVLLKFIDSRIPKWDL